jgi:predicted MFS family arabinose efflux permease
VAVSAKSENPGYPIAPAATLDLHEQTTATAVPGFAALAVTMFAMTMAMSVVESIQPNFFRDEIGMTGDLNGYLIAIRELPGFLLIFVAAFLLRLGLARATAISLAVAGAGYAIFAPMTSFWMVIIPTLICSVGYHSWLQLQPALGLSLAKKGEEGSVLGRLNGIGFFGSMLGMLAVLVSLEAIQHWTSIGQGPILRAFFVLSGAAAVIGAISIRRFPTSADDRAAAQVAPRITWRREYRLYYWLALLDGSRMQIYFAFAPFVLVEHFNVSAERVIIVLIVAALIKWRTGAVIGRMVDRYGEKRMLTLGYFLHLAVFLGFAFAPNVWIAYLCYVGYNFMFLFSIGTTTYLKKICRREDLAPSLAMGVSLSHLTAIVVPVVAASLWSKLGYQFPFIFGTVFIFGSLYLTQKIDVARQRWDASAAA